MKSVNAKSAKNLVARDLADDPARPKAQSKPRDYERNKRGVYGGKPEARQKVAKKS